MPSSDTQANPPTLLEATFHCVDAIVSAVPRQSATTDQQDTKPAARSKPSKRSLAPRKESPNYMKDDLEDEPVVALSLPTDPLALVPSNPAVLQIGSRLRWKPTTVVSRVQKALPSTFEQSLYLLLAKDFGIQPESLAKILDTYYGSRGFIAADMLERRKVGPELYSDTFAQFVEFFETCMYLMRLVTDEIGTSVLSMELAAELVVAYGDQEAEQLVESFCNNLDVYCDILNVNQRRSYSDRARTCLYIFLKGYLEETQKSGTPNLLGVEDYNELRMARHCSMSQVGVPYIDKDIAEQMEADELLSVPPVYQQSSVEETVNYMAFRFPSVL